MQRLIFNLRDQAAAFKGKIRLLNSSFAFHTSFFYKIGEELN